MNRANRIYSRPGIFYIFLALVFTQLEPTQAQVYFKADAGKDFRFGNQYLERCFELKNDTWRTTWLVNKRTGHTWRVSSDEFRIRAVFERLGYWAGAENPLEISASSCVLHSYRIEPEKDGTRRLIATYHWEQGLSDGTGENTDSRSPGLDIEVFYTLARDEPYMRKTLRVSCPEPGLYFIEELAVENMTVAGAAALHQGFGQPVYTEEMFFGLEYPAGNNRVDEQKRLELFYYPGAEVGIRGVESYSAVWGAARWMRTRAAFLDYVKDIRIAPARPFLLYNTWYDMRTPERAQSDKGETRQGDNLDHTNCLERIQSLKKNLVDHGIELNSFVLDEG
ncbi:MAG: hypothetical protein U9P14_07005, partial [Gemmatimonadota bacterium]|nr:hypothetical protein [Gemmatimonadota bacterium]